MYYFRTVDTCIRLSSDLMNKGVLDELHVKEEEIDSKSMS